MKLGSTTLISGDLEALGAQVAVLKARGLEVAVVSSGAVACGMEVLGLTERPTELALVQAYAAAGQAELMARWGAAMAAHGVRCAQILLTHEDLSDRRHFLNARHTLQALLRLGLVPIVNENDTVATEELRFGDNDRLAAALATVMDADLVVLLSDVDAVYDRDPADEGAAPVRRVEIISESLRAAAGASGSALGVGGMASKLEAAELAQEAGIPLVVASGSEADVLLRIVEGHEVGTRFLAADRSRGLRRHWIGFLSKVRGEIHVDAGATRALEEKGSSLLAAGVRRATGAFERGDAVVLVGPEGEEIGRGLVAYGLEEVQRIAGCRSEEVRQILGQSVVDPVIHRDDLMMGRRKGNRPATRRR